MAFPVHSNDLYVVGCSYDEEFRGASIVFEAYVGIFVEYLENGQRIEVFFSFVTWKKDIAMGGVQNLELSNVERPIFRNFKITNIKIAKDELFSYFMYDFFVFFNYLNTQSIWFFPNYNIF